jgi:hypothetical protein
MARLVEVLVASLGAAGRHFSLQGGRNAGAINVNLVACLALGGFALTLGWLRD